MEPENPIKGEINEFTCLSCTSTFKEIKDQDILCPQGHFFCSSNSCSKLYSDLIFSEPHNYYPGKCSICKEIIAQSQLEKLMTENQKAIFAELALKFGPNAEVKESKSIETLIEEIKDISTDNKTELIKSLVEEIIEKESQVFCPKCGLGGRKDLECNHISCVCGTYYCYVCGQAEEDVDKGSEGIYGHFEEWETIPERCPMYLYSICIKDERYPDNEADALNLFHLQKIKKELKKLFSDFEKENIYFMEKEHKILESYNLNLEEILNSDIVLINRD